MRGEGRVFLRGHVWWIAYSGPGEDGNATEIRESSGSDSESTAKKILRDRLREVANHRSGVRAFAGPRADRLTIGDLLKSLEADYKRRGIKSLRRTVNHAKHVRDFFGHYRAVAVTADMIRRYIEMRRDLGRSSAKINRELEVLAAAFSLAIREERIARKPHVPHLSENNARKGFFEAHEHALILQHLDSPMDEMARFAYFCGWRKDEIRTLRWENVDRAAMEVRLFDSKNGEGRAVTLDATTWQVFERRWAARQFETSRGTALSEYVFHIEGKPVGDSHFTKLWVRARNKAGAAVKMKIFHDYRRTAARNMIRAGVSESVAMQITGHKTNSMFRRYNIVSAEDKRAALQRVNEYLDAQPKEGNVKPIEKSNSDKTRTIRASGDTKQST